MESHIYNVDIRWQEGRMGIMCSPELKDAAASDQSCLEVATPPEFENGIPGIWSPEHLFTASVSSCLMTTFLAISQYSKLDYLDFSCSAEGKLEKVNKQLLMTEIVLKPVVTVEDEKNVPKAQRVLAKAEQNCLISNSIKSRVIMEPEVRVSELVS